ncbi:MAG: DUF4350 domain-containing protein [Methylacidiphilales bacterium]|nr:DUF4350 domain-containing protein [Candidatus Methylacidiphilales bacterium]
MNRNIAYVRVLLVILAVVILLAFLNRTPQRGSHDAWLPSSFNPVGAGHMALFQTLSELNWPVDRWREPLSRLANYGTGNVLVITRSQAAARVTFSEQEIDLLDDWVKKGNTILLLGALGDWDDTRMFLRQIGFTVPEEKGSVADLFQPFHPGSEQSIQVQPGPGSAEPGTLILPAVTALPIAYPAGARVLWQQEGEPYVVDVPRGAGHVICGASDQILSNKYLGQGDDFAVVLRLLMPSGEMPRHIFFEETHHGYSAVYALAHLLNDPGVRFGGMLALLGGLAFLGSSLLRFGPVIPLEREAGRSMLEFVDSMADLYRRADLRNEMVRVLFNETHQKILQRLNLPPTVSHEVISSRLQQANPHLPKWKKLAQRFDSREYKSGLPPSGWLRVTRDLIEIKSAMA